MGMNNGICKRCHRKLKDKKSIELGFGKICYEKQIKQYKNYLFDMGVTNEATNKK